MEKNDPSKMEENIMKYIEKQSKKQLKIALEYC